MVEVVVELLEVAGPEEPVSGGPHGFGSGSRFSVLEGVAPELSAFPPKAEKGLFPNCINKWEKKEKTKHRPSMSDLYSVGKQGAKSMIEI